jgi:uncharacterized protein YoxC
MITNLELQKQVEELKQHVQSLQASTNRLRDDVDQIKTNQGKLVDGVRERFETLEGTFPT